MKHLQKIIFIAMFSMATHWAVGDTTFGSEPIINVYPNPFIDNLSVDVEEGETYSFIIENSERKIIHVSYHEGDKTINLDLQKGEYVIRVIGEKNAYIQRFICDK